MQHANAALLTILTTVITMTLGLGPAGCSDGPGAGPAVDAVTAADAGQEASTDGQLAPDTAPAFDPQLQKLAAWMTGRFSSAAQAKQDLTFYHITLDMKRIWPDRTDGYWLYVEQAMAGSLPYRQRVYRLTVAGSTLSSAVYEFASTAEADKAVGSFKQDKPLSQLTPQDLKEKTGCAVLLTWDAKAGLYSGATKPKACLTTYNGASYTTSDVQVSKSKLSSWDRGFDSGEQQVWGAVKGPYIFDKLQDLDPALAK